MENSHLISSNRTIYTILVVELLVGRLAIHLEFKPWIKSLDVIHLTFLRPVRRWYGEVPYGYHQQTGGLSLGGLNLN